jgi:hypothetical protein
MQYALFVWVMRTMPSRAVNFKKTDMQRMVRAAQAAGLRITGVVLEGSKVVLRVDETTASEPNPWDEHDEDPAKRPA